MDTRKPEIKYSDPVSEIISRPPRKIVRWGTTSIFLLFALIIIIAWFIRYPDIVPATIEITTVNPPVTLTTRITGKIKNLYVRDGEKVGPGKVLAVMETAASINEIKTLNNIIDTINNPERISSGSLPKLAELGEVQIFYANFMKILSDYDNYTRNDYFGNKIDAIYEEIKATNEYLTRVKAKEKLLVLNLAIENNKYRRDSLLYLQKVFSESDFENSKQAYIRTSLDLQEVRLDLSAKTLEITQKLQLIEDLRINKQKEKENLIALLYEALMNLKAQIKIWENNYLLISPVSGTIIFTRFWSENQSVVKDQAVLNVVPENTGEFLGRIYLKMQKSGKVKIGQIVNIKLSGFPYLEYGMVRGIVKARSAVPSGDEYIIDVSLPQGLTTLYGKQLEFTQNMQGRAEIITDNLRLLQKIFNPFRYLITKNKPY